MSFLLFAGMDFYPSGGWHDYVGEYDSLDAAQDAFNVDPPPWAWGHIVENGRITHSYTGWVGLSRSNEWREVEGDG